MGTRFDPANHRDEQVSFIDPEWVKLDPSKHGGTDAVQCAYIICIDADRVYHGADALFRNKVFMDTVTSADGYRHITGAIRQKAPKTKEGHPYFVLEEVSEAQRRRAAAYVESIIRERDDGTAVIDDAHTDEAELFDTATVYDDWPTPASLMQTDEGGVPFPLKSLPDTLRRYVEHRAAVMKVYPEMVVSNVLSAVGIVGAGYVASPTSGLEISPVIQTTLGSRPSTRKSAGVKGVGGLLNNVCERVQQVFDEERLDWQVRHAEAERKYKAIKKQRTKDAESRSDEAETFTTDDERNALNALQSIAAQEVMLPTFVVSDATQAALENTAMRNYGLVFVSTEENRAYETLQGRYTNGRPDGVAAINNGWNREGAIVARGDSRRGRTVTHIGIAMAVQPEVLQSAVDYAPLTTTGYWSRHLVVQPNSTTGERKNMPDVKERTNVALDLENLLYRTLSATWRMSVDNAGDDEAHIRMKFSSKAAELFAEYEDECEDRVVAAADPFLEDWWGKQHVQAAKLAMILALGDDRTTVRGVEMEHAIEIMEWYAGEMYRFRDATMMTPAAVSQAERFLRWIRSPRGQDTLNKRESRYFTRNEAFNALKGGEGRAIQHREDMDPLLALLLVTGHIRQVRSVAANSERYVVHPAFGGAR